MIRFLTRAVRAVFGLAFIGAAFYLFLIPEAVVIYRLSTDAGLKTNTVPDTAYAIHRSLSPRYANYARTRVHSGVASRLEHTDIAPTEWPLFGSCFYLWATESLQQAWEALEAEYRELTGPRLDELNAAIKEADVPAIRVETKDG